MLAYLLALIVGLGSFAFYMAAFFLPEVHRKSDFYWSGIALFYALVLWVCAKRITGGLLLGEIAGVSVLGWLGWQTLALRRAIAPSEERTEISPALLTEQAKKLSLMRIWNRITNLFRRQKPEAPPPPSTQESSSTAPETAAASQSESTPEVAHPEPPTPQAVAEAQPEHTQERTPLPEAEVETEVAPDAQLAPPAEDTGPGNAQARQNLVGEEEIVSPPTAEQPETTEEEPEEK